MGKRPARFVEKPWGHEEIFAETDRYVGKLLVIKAGEALSLQYHQRKEETLRVFEGRMLFTTGVDIDNLTSFEMGPGEVFHVTPGLLHRMEAVTDCTMLEVSTPDLDDVVRLEDRYGRQGTSDP
jgi:mannose-6-phosphate isomerase-like protein (cupin superfamily)